MPTSAPLLLIVTTFFWGGNVVAGKLAVGDVSPLLLTFLRWFISGSVLYAISRHEIAVQWAQVKPRLLYVTIMAVLGFTAFNSMYYSAAAYTSGINIAIIQGSTPVIVLIGAALLGARLKAAQIFGILLTLIGVCFVASKGDIANLIGLKFNFGDLLLLTASILYAGYTLALRRRPPMPALVFFFFLAFASAVTSIPARFQRRAHRPLCRPVSVARVPSLLYSRARDCGPGACKRLLQSRADLRHISFHRFARRAFLHIRCHRSRPCRGGHCAGRRLVDEETRRLNLYAASSKRRSLTA